MMPVSVNMARYLLLKEMLISIQEFTIDDTGGFCIMREEVKIINGRFSKMGTFVFVVAHISF